MTTEQTILMCAPGHFGVDYVINPWMQNHTGRVDRQLAARQWHCLQDLLARLTGLTFIEPEPGVPDMVFTANAGLVRGQRVIVSRFRSRERQAEEPHLRAWFTDNGFEIVDWPRDVAFEGAGDALFDRGRPLLWIGYGFRTDRAAAALVEKALGCCTEALELVDPHFYHLDTCFCPLEGGWLLCYPAAFAASSLERIRALVPQDKRIEVGHADALHFACNAVNIGRHVIMNHASEVLQRDLRGAGFEPVLTPLSEFMKSGGAAKCLTLKLIEG
jgi:arginine dihydrolase